MENASPVFCVSLDFELEWGVRDIAGLSAYRENLRGERAAVRAILDAFVRRGIHATWATVGFLFCESKEELLAAAPEHKPSYRDRSLDPYAMISHEVGADETRDPFHFAASLVKEIAETPGQEVGTHTFSHYYCLEDGQTARDFADDLASARRIAEKRGVTLKSLVFPRNQVRDDYLGVMKDAGLAAFRSNPRSRLYSATRGAEDSRLRRIGRLVDAYVPLTGDNVQEVSRASSGLTDVPASRFLRPYSRRLRALEPLRLRRILAGLDAAAKKRGVYHLWWHPHNFGVSLEENLAFLDRVLARVETLRRTHDMKCLNMGEIAELGA